MGVKPGYRQTEVGVIPEDWGVEALGRSCDIVTKGTTPTSIGRTFTRSGVVFLKAESLSESGNIIPEKVAYIDTATHTLLKRSQLKGDDVLISIAGVLGRVGLVEESALPANTNQALAIVRLGRHSQFERSFLFHALRSSCVSRQIRDINVQAAQANISLQNVRDFVLPTPSTPEQRAIAAALSDVDALLGGLDRLIAKKRDLKQAAMQQLLTGQTRLPGFSGEWEVKRLADVAEFCAGTYLAQDEYRDGEYEVQGAGSVMGHHDVPNFSEAVSVVGRVGTVGRPRFMPTGCWVNNNAAAIVAREPFGTPEFVHLLLLMADWSKATSVTAQPFLVVPALLAMEFSVPESAEQRAISTILSDMDTELAALEARRNKTRDLKQAMMQELLTGKTRLVRAGAADA